MNGDGANRSKTGLFMPSEFIDEDERAPKKRKRRPNVAQKTLLARTRIKRAPNA